MTTVSEIFETMAYGPAPESDKPALEWLERHGRAFGLFVGGRWIKSKNGDAFDVVNPATTAPLARVTQAGRLPRATSPRSSGWSGTGARSGCSTAGAGSRAKTATRSTSAIQPRRRRRPGST